MRSMLSLTLWYMWHSFINSLKRHWKLYLGIVVFIAAMVGLAFYAKSTEPPHEQEIQQEGNNISQIGDIIIVEDENSIIVYEGNKTFEIDGYVFLELIVGAVILLLVAIGIRGGAKNGVNIFSMADVNFLFPSPNKPQNVLSFRMLSQIGTALIGSIYILFQIPNYVSEGMITVGGGVCIFVAFVFLTIASNYIGIFTYLMLADKPAARRFVEKFIFLILGIPVLMVAFMKFILRMGIVESTLQVIRGDWSRWIPFFGWLRAFVVLSAQGEYLNAFGFFALSVLFIVALVKFTWGLKADFYEDSLTFATMQQDMIQKIDNKQKGGLDYARKHDSKAEQKKWDRRRNNSIVFSGYEGSKVFFAKTILNRKRMHRLGGLLSGNFISALAYGAGLILVAHYLVGEMRALEFYLGYMIIILVGIFFRSFVNPLQMDLNVNFMYMIPERPSSIICWDMLGYVIDGMIDSLPVIPVTYILTGDIIIAVVSYIAVVVLHSYFGMVALMAEIVIKSYMPKYLSVLIQTILRFLPVVLIVFLIIIMLEAGFVVNLYIPVAVVIGIYALITVLFIWPCAAFLHRGRK